MKRDSEPGLLYYPPQALEHLSDTSDFPLAWEEMIQDADLGHNELTTLLGLSEKCDLSIAELLLLYLRYWENMSGQEIANKYNVDKATISRWLKKAKKKLRPKLLATISLSRKEQK